MDLANNKRVDFITARIRRLVDEKQVAVSAIALKSGVEQGTVKALYERRHREKRTIAGKTADKVEAGLDAQERALGMVKRCSKCGRELPYGWFYADKERRDGMRSACKECVNAQMRGKRAGKGDSVNNNTENAITAEIVRKVREEDKRDVESKFMAPYFKLTPKQLDEIRRGQWDKLLLTPEVPKRADSVLEAVEMLRGEVAGLRREVQRALLEMGLEVSA